MTTIAQWNFLGPGVELMPSARVTLRNTKENKSLRFGERENGIELVWDNATDLGNVRVQRQSGGASAIAYATPVALRFDTGGYLRYANRSTGINLDWSATPRFEWEITGGPPGTPVRLNRPAALLNTTHGDHLIYDERPEGINLRWYADLDISKVVPGATEWQLGRVWRVSAASDPTIAIVPRPRGSADPDHRGSPQDGALPRKQRRRARLAYLRLDLPRGPPGAGEPPE